MCGFIKKLFKSNNMKTLTDVRNEITAVQSSLADIQTELQALIDAVPVPDIPKITIPLNTPVELVL